MLPRALILPALLAAALPASAAEPPYVVDRADIVQEVRERGVIQPAAAVDLVAPGGTRERPLVIKWVIEDGSQVKKGQRVLEFDDGLPRELLQQQQLTVEQFAAGALAAERDLKLAELELRKQLRSAEAALETARLMVKKSTDAEALTKKRLMLKLKLADTAVARARAAVEDKNTASTKTALESAEIERELAALDVEQFALTEGSAKRELELREREVSDEIELIKLRGEQRRAQADANVQAARAALVQEKAKLDALAEDVHRCVVLAPQDGLAVYASSKGRFDNDALVAQGEPVIAGQRLLRICNLAKVKVETRVPEGQVSWLRTGQTARVRVDALPEREFAGRVESVATVAAPMDFRNRDARAYPVAVALGEANTGLKPGMSADVVIHIATAPKALRVPVGSIVRTGRKTTCAVDAPNGVRETPVVLGISDGRFVQIKAGLNEGDKVLMPTK